jgi:3-deoxy-D-manno-octulosonate 8-phosphate phosphatase KdsC-like HAD superfamily phosphatase
MDKLLAAEDLIKRHNVPWSAVAFIGDELNDLELLKTVVFRGARPRNEGSIQLRGHGRRWFYMSEGRRSRCGT